MSSPVNLEVFLHICFINTHFFTVLVGQDFRSAAGQRLKPCRPQLFQYFADAESADAGEEINFSCRVGLEGYLRKTLIQGFQ
ncbi:hypothetical protein D3C81_1624250 [compost metagenome]